MVLLNEPNIYSICSQHIVSIDFGEKAAGIAVANGLQYFDFGDLGIFDLHVPRVPVLQQALTDADEAAEPNDAAPVAATPGEVLP